MLKVLIVEDEPHVVHLLRVNFERQGFSSASAGTLAEARKKVVTERPDLILLDRKLPDGDSLTLLKELKANTETERIPVIMVTAKDKEDQVAEGQECGAALYITKPFDPVELMASIKRILEPVEKEQSPNWDARCLIRTEVRAGHPYDEGFPNNPVGKKYQLILCTGIHCTATVDLSRQYSAEGRKWQLSSGGTVDKDPVIAWREC